MTSTAWGDDVQVRLYTADSRTAFGPELIPLSLTYTTQRPGGCHGMTVSIEPVPCNFWRPFAHVAVIVNHVVVWEGRVNPPRFYGQWLTGFSASGYGFSALADQPYFSSDTSEVTSGTILEAALADAAPAVVYGPSDDPAGTDVAARYDRMTVADILAAMVAKGTVEGKPLDWFVWPREGRGKQSPQLILRQATAPTTAHYHVSTDDVTLEPRDADLWGRVTVNYTATNQGTATILTGGTSVTVTHDLGIIPELNEINVTSGGNVRWWINTRTATSFRINASGAVAVDVDFGWVVTIPDVLTSISPTAGFVDRYGIDRRAIVNGGDLTTAAAEQLRDTQASILGTRRYATSISRRDGQSLPGHTGVPTTHFTQVRADGWVRVGDTKTFVPIVATTVDPFAGSLDVMCGEQRSDFVAIWRETQRTVRRRRDGLNDSSGAKERRG